MTNNGGRDTEMNCDLARERIQSLLDGALAADEEARLARHAAFCEACAAALAEARTLAAALMTWRRVDVPAHFATNILSAIRAARPVPRPMPMGVAWVLVAVSAIATAALFFPPVVRELASFLLQGAERGTSRATTSAQGLAVVVAALAPLCERFFSLISPITAPAVAVAKAFSTVLLHVMTDPASFVMLALLALVAGALLKFSRFPHERRDLHARIR
ncbi:MAG: zf-HC2 domain-containing protein [bacterium]